MPQPKVLKDVFDLTVLRDALQQEVERTRRHVQIENAFLQETLQDERRKTQRKVQEEKAKRSMEAAKTQQVRENEKAKRALAQSRSPTGLQRALWHEVGGPELLHQDVRSGKTLGKKPKEVWLSREAYQKVSLGYFRQRLYATVARYEEPKSNRDEHDRAASTEYPEYRPDACRSNSADEQGPLRI